MVLMFFISKLLDKPRLNIERQRSFDERSLSELSIGLSRGIENYESAYSPGRSALDTPTSSARNSFEPHPMVADAWEALRRSLVSLRGQPVGTIAAYDHASEEILNYDQENEITSPDPPLPETQRCTIHSFCKTLTASDTSTHGGFSVLRRHADDFTSIGYVSATTLAGVGCF